MRTKRFICTVGLVLLSIFLIFSGITACEKRQAKESELSEPTYPYTVSFQMEDMFISEDGRIALPLLKFFEKSGAKVIWINSKKAIVLYDNTSMVYHLQEDPLAK